MKKIIAAGLLVLSTFSFAQSKNLKCGDILLKTPFMEQAEVNKQYYEGTKAEKLWHSYFRGVRFVIENRGFRVINEFELAYINNKSFTYDYEITLDKEEGTFDYNKYIMTVRDADGTFLFREVMKTAENGLFNKNKKYLKMVTGRLQNCQ